MNAPYQASPGLIASIERMRARSWLDTTVSAFESGLIDTWPATRRRQPGGRQLSLIARRPQRSPDKQKSYERRHRLAFSGPMPHHLAAEFTVSQMAVFRVVGDEHRGRGRCDLTLDEIGARAGCCRKSAQRAMYAAKDARLITIEERRPKGQRKHLPNVVRIVSPEWLTWLAHGRLKAMKTGHLSPTTDNRLKEDGDDTAHGATLRALAASGQPTRAEVERPSAEAVAFALELASIAGHRQDALPLPWTAAKPEWLVELWLKQIARFGMGVDTLRKLTVAVMRRKPDRCPPRSPRYFSEEVAKLVGRCAARRPVPMAA
jgi:hypothetical protein